MQILVVDDDRSVRESLGRALTLHGYDVDLAEHGMAALQRVARGDIDAIILDVMMPGVDGFGVLRRLRQDHDDTPVLLLTARDAVADRVEGLDVGGDDYLVKPFALDELLARLRALLRRAGAGADADEAAARTLRFGDLSLDPPTMEVRRGDRVIELTRTEYDLLLAFMDNPNRVLTKDQLVERVWGYAGTASNTLEVYVGYLRRKLEADGEARVIQTVRGFGYALREPS